MSGLIGIMYRFKGRDAMHLFYKFGWQYRLKNNNPVISKENKGMILGFIAIACFSITLPATRLAVLYIDPVLVGLGRSLLVAIPAFMVILWLKIPAPNRRQWRSIIIVMLGIVIGFPLLTSLSMQKVSGAQGGIVVSMLPLFTAIIGALMLKQRLSSGFWLMTLLGSSLVLFYLLWGRQHELKSSEWILFGASIICAVGYAEGGKLAKEIGGIAVISWALVVSLPFTLISLLFILRNYQVAELWQAALQIPAGSWLGFLYISIISQWLAFMFWYKGLAMGGVIRVSQIQLLQPFLTLLVSMIMLGEHISLRMILFAIAVVITVAVGRKMPIYEKINNGDKK